MKDFHFTHIPPSPLTNPPAPTQAPSHVSRPCSNAPVRSPTGSGWTPGNHGQPGGVRQVLPVPAWGIANAGFWLGSAGDIGGA